MDNIWPPYTAYKSEQAPIEVVGASGCVIKTKDGREIIDGISSWWVACHGYNNHHLVKAVTTQAEKLQHIMFAGFTHNLAQKLAKRLAKLTNLPYVFFSDSGSTAVEVALKMAVQFYKNSNKNSKKQRFIHFTNSYHGDSMGAMSVSDNNQMHSPFVGYMPMQFQIEIPSDEIAFEEFDALLASQKNQIAGVIIEPLVQMAGGMKFHTPDVLAEIYRITKKHDILFIADEIATGFGRTGYMFACEEAGITPDILCIGKALTGGMVTMAATLATENIFKAFSEHNFMHGTTYMANPIACAAANASLDLFEAEPQLNKVACIEQQLNLLLAPFKNFSCVKDVRVKGAIGVIQLSVPVNIAKLRQEFLNLNVNIRPFADVIYLAPPFVISNSELQILANAIENIINKISSSTI